MLLFLNDHWPVVEGQTGEQEDDAPVKCELEWRWGLTLAII